MFILLSLLYKFLIIYTINTLRIVVSMLVHNFNSITYYNNHICNIYTHLILFLRASEVLSLNFMSLLATFHPQPFNKLLLKTYYEPNIGSLAHVTILCLNDHSASVALRVTWVPLGTAEPWKEVRRPNHFHQSTEARCALLLAPSPACAVQFSRGHRRITMPSL